MKSAILANRVFDDGDQISVVREEDSSVQIFIFHDRKSVSYGELLNSGISDEKRDWLSGIISYKGEDYGTSGCERRK